MQVYYMFEIRRISPQKGIETYLSSDHLSTNLDSLCSRIQRNPRLSPPTILQDNRDTMINMSLAIKARLYNATLRLPKSHAELLSPVEKTVYHMPLPGHHHLCTLVISESCDLLERHRNPMIVVGKIVPAPVRSGPRSLELGCQFIVAAVGG